MTTDQIEGSTRRGLGRLQDAVGGLTGDAKTQVEGKFNQTAGSIQDAVGQVRDQAQDFYETAESYAREQPLAALAITLGLGIVIGLVLRNGQKTVYVRR